MLALSDEPLLTDDFPPAAPHNIGARLLRHGLAVTAFSSLEKYVGSRFDELLGKIQASRIPYSAFSEELKLFLTRDAAAGLLNRVSFLEESGRQGYFDTSIVRVAGYQSVPAVYTAFGFSPRGSNVGHEDIKKALAALGLKDAWGRLLNVTGSIGSARVSLMDDYRNLAKTRHKSAHDPDSNVPTSDLKTHIENCILIGIAVDVLTCELADAYIGAKSIADLGSRLASISPAFRFVDQQSNGAYAERAGLSGRTVKRYPTEPAAIAGAKARASPAFIVVRSVSTLPLALI